MRDEIYVFLPVNSLFYEIRYQHSHQTKIIRTLNQSVKGSDLSIISNILTLTAKSINTLFMRFESRQRVYTYTLCLDFMLYFYDLVDFLFPADRHVSCKVYINICQST